MNSDPSFYLSNEDNIYANLQEYFTFEESNMERFSHIDPTFEFKPSSIADYIPMIFYINLDHRTDRKELLEKELNELGLPFERFSAIKDSFGAVGCSKSHLAVLNLAKERGYPRVMVLEDDFTFIGHRNNIEQTISQIRDEAKPYDVCLVSYNSRSSKDVPESYWKRVVNSQTTSGYIIQQHYYDTLINNVAESIPLLEKTRTEKLYAIDIYWKKLQRTGTWYQTTDRLGKQRISFSDIRKRKVDYKV